MEHRDVTTIKTLWLPGEWQKIDILLEDIASQISVVNDMLYDGDANDSENSLHLEVSPELARSRLNVSEEIHAHTLDLQKRAEIMQLSKNQLLMARKELDITMKTLLDMKEHGVDWGCVDLRPTMKPQGMDDGGPEAQESPLQQYELVMNK